MDKFGPSGRRNRGSGGCAAVADLGEHALDGPSDLTAATWSRFGRWVSAKPFTA